jgi:Fe-Mn family superoxide dismutase
MPSANKTRKLRKGTVKQYKPIDFSYLLGKVKGIDNDLMKIHFKLYEGLVGATNGALQMIHNTAKAGTVQNMVAYSSVQNQLGFFFNGMRLHEMYFGVMAGENMDHMDEDFNADIKRNFGSFNAWKNDFTKDVGNIPGVGFVVLCRDKTSGRLFNNWINEFQTGELIGVDPILVMDMWEHAYIAEFGLNLQKYKETFLNNVNWSVVSKCWRDSVNGIQNPLLKQ